MKLSLSRALIPLAAATLVLSAACGGDKKAGDGAFSPVGQPGSGGDVSKVVDDLAKNPEKAQKLAEDVSKKGMSGAGTCQVKVSGDENVSFSSGGGAAAVGSDYWYSEAELRQALKLITKATSGKSDAEVNREVDEAMKQDPRFTLLILNCGSASGGEGSVSLLPGGGSTYADVPFGARSYPIAKGGALGGGAKAGEFSVIFQVKDGVYGVDEPGELKITKFDKSGIAGTFSFKASERFSTGAAKKVAVQGTFDFPCPAGDNCKR